MCYRRLHHVIGVLIFACVGSSVAVADETADKLKAYLQACAEVEGFNGSVLVAKQGQPLVSQGYGFANFEHRVANMPRTRFRLGSITKQFSAMAVMILQEQGKLKLNDPVARHYSQAPESWKDIQIHHLLSHTSGLANFTNFPSYRQNWMLASPPEKTIGMFKDLPLEFAPGEKFAYSNSGYVLLGKIIENAAQTSYAEFVKANIFEPLGMKDSGYDTHAAVIEDRADGYNQSGENRVNAPYLDMTWPHAAGALYSTVEDLLRWDQALLAGKLISRESMDTMFTPVKNGYAYGWSISEKSGRKQIAHGGGINGFSTYILRVPTENVCIVVLSNVVPSQPGRMAIDLAAILFGEPYNVPKIRQVAKIDTKLLEGYVGRYQLAPQFVLTITKEGDRLFVQATGQPKNEVFPESETKFFLKVVDAQVSFIKDDKGAVKELILHQNGLDQRAQRLAEPEPDKKP